MSEKDAEHRLAEASRLVSAELHKTGTPEYDIRAHERALEAERKAREAVEAARTSEH